MTTPSTLRLEVATADDIPALTELWFAAFKDPDMQHLWPDTSGVRKWWAEANRHDMLNKPFQRYIKIVDTKSTDARGKPQVAAFAKWDLAMPTERGRRYPHWHEDMPAHDCDVFFEREETERRRVMGDQKHYCTRSPAYFYVGNKDCFWY